MTVGSRKGLHFNEDLDLIYVLRNLNEYRNLLGRQGSWGAIVGGEESMCFK